MTVYVMGCEGSRLVKIGSTAGDPAKRLAELQTGSPYPLRLLWLSTPEHGIETEIKLHKLFEAYRTNGEWFDFGDADPAALANATIKLPPPGAPARPPARRQTAPTVKRPDPKPRASSCGLLNDLDGVLSDAPVPAAKVPGLLLAKYPDEVQYKAMTSKSLVAALAKLGVKVPSTGNRWIVQPASIRSALASRTMAPAVGA